MKKIIKGIIGILMILLVIILIVENLEQLSKELMLKVDLYFWAWKSSPMAFYLVVIIVFLLGILVASFYGIVERFKLKKEIRILSKESREKDKELDSFRNPPIVESKES